MGFIKKLTETVSKGVTSATEKAQQTVEITRLHAQVAGKRREIEKKYETIGQAVFEAYLVQDLSKAEATVIPVCEEIVGLRREIAALEERIKELRNEKECECGQRVPYETRFCPSCGRKFPEAPAVQPKPDEPEAGAEPADAAAEEAGEPEVEVFGAPVSPAEPARCPACSAELEPEDRFCPQCGARAG